MSNDDELWQAFVLRRDGDAFRRVVERYTGVVYAAARRQVRDAHLAEDVTQAVFILLARKASSLVGKGILAGWLVATARLAAKTARRGEDRRLARERRAAQDAPVSTS